MSEPLSHLVQQHLGEEVTVYFLGEGDHSDSGTLTDFDGAFFRLERRSDTLLIPVSGVRMIKLRSTSDQAQRRLPRAVGGPPE